MIPLPFDRTIRRLAERRSPLGGAAALLVGVIALAVWAILAEVPLYVSSVEARVVAFGDSIPIESPVAGRVAEVLVAVGQPVEAGQVMVRLDTEALELELASNNRELELYQQLVADADQELTAVKSIAESDHGAAGAVVEEALAQRKREQREQAQVSRESRRAARLAEAGLLSKQEAERARSQAASGRAAMAAQSSRVTQAELRARTAGLELEVRMQRLTRELHEFEVEITRRKAATGDLEYRMQLHTIRAAVNGRVGEIRPLAPGTVVEIGTKLGALVPRKGLRVISYFDPSEAFGWIRAGQRARVRLRGYPSTQFGSLEAKVALVAGEVQDGKLRVEFELLQPGDFPVDLQHGLPAVTQVQVDSQSPVGLVLRAAGKLVARE